jgi:hypothetical protein
MEPMRTMLRTAAVSGVLALSLTGCVPSEPSVDDWRASTSQALEDTASEVHSVALVLDLQAHGRLPGRAARVAAVESEESLATAVEGATTQQPPPGEAREDRQVGELLSRASDLVREARIALTAGDESSYAELRRQLTDLADEVDTAREGLQ